MMSQTPAPKESDRDAMSVQCQGLSLHTAFQPIVSVTHCRVVGHEALLRGRDTAQRPLTPAELFPRLVKQMSTAEVDETCSTLHLGSFSAQERDGWLFINANPSSVLDRAAVSKQFSGWLKDAGVEPHRVVVEIVETRVHDERRLADAVLGFRDVGCLVAIDDFGAGESNFERIWRLRPDLVKIDRAMLTEAADNPLVRRILPGIVSLLHEAGCLVVIEGIETETQALIALESDADFVQGFFFSLPSRHFADPAQIRARFASLNAHLRAEEAERNATDQGYYTSFAGGLAACVAALEDGDDLTDACSVFLAVAGVQRMYLLDAEGYQVGQNVESPDSLNDDPRFAPCAKGEGASWYRRPYFQRAIREPNHAHASRPYLSVRDANPCVTLSYAFETAEGLQVLCADLDHDQGEPLSRRAPRESGIQFR